MLSGTFEITTTDGRPIGGGGNPVGRVSLRLRPGGDPTALALGLFDHMFVVERIETLPFDRKTASDLFLVGAPVAREDKAGLAALTTDAPAAAAAPSKASLVRAEDLSAPGLRALMERAGLPALPANARREDLLAAVAPLFEAPGAPKTE